MWSLYICSIFFIFDWFSFLNNWQDSRVIRDDRISELPDEILHEIVSRLTLWYAVRTSALSSKWRYICSSQSSLVFDWVNVFQTSENVGFWESWRSPCRCKEYKDAFISSVNQFICSYRYRSTNISLFEVSFCLGRECQPQIDEWVKFAFEWASKSSNFVNNAVREVFLIPMMLEGVSSALMTTSMFFLPMRSSQGVENRCHWTWSMSTCAHANSQVKLRTTDCCWSS